MFHLAAAAAESSELSNELEKGLQTIDQLPGEVADLPMLHHFAEVIPVADLVFGGSLLIVVMLVHATGLRLIGDYVSRRVDSIVRHPSLWHADLLMGSIISLLLALHVFEIFVWSCALVVSGLIPNWHDAGFFAGNTYTTIGYGNFVLSAEWEMVAPIMAISGLVHVRLVRQRTGRLRAADPADQRCGARPEARHPAARAGGTVGQIAGRAIPLRTKASIASATPSGS